MPGAPQRKPNRPSHKVKATRLREHAREQAVEQAIKLFTAPGGKTKQVHLSDIASECVRAFKGPRGLALRLYMQFLKAPDGSHTRTKILDLVMKLVVSDTVNNSAGGNEVDDMDEGEMNAELYETITGGTPQDSGDPSSREDISRFEEEALESERDDPEVLELEEEIRRFEDGAPTSESPAERIRRIIQEGGED